MSETTGLRPSRRQWFTLIGPAHPVPVGPTYHYPLTLNITHAMTQRSVHDLIALWDRAAAEARIPGRVYQLPARVPEEMAGVRDLAQDLARVVATDWDLMNGAQAGLHPAADTPTYLRCVTLAIIAVGRARGRTVLRHDGSPWNSRLRRFPDGTFPGGADPDAL